MYLEANRDSRARCFKLNVTVQAVLVPATWSHKRVEKGNVDSTSPITDLRVELWLCSVSNIVTSGVTSGDVSLGLTLEIWGTWDLERPNLAPPLQPRRLLPEGDVNTARLSCSASRNGVPDDLKEQAPMLRAHSHSPL